MSGTNEMSPQGVLLDPDNCGEQGAVGEEDPTAPDNITPLPRRRSYLDACRDQGVFQKDEETRAELFETKAEIAATRLEVRRQHSPGNRLSPKLELVMDEPKRPIPRSMAEAAMMREVEVKGRLRGVFLAFTESGLGIAWLPFLEHTLFDRAIDRDEAVRLFQACCATERAPQSAVDTDQQAFERRRLGEEGDL